MERIKRHINKVLVLGLGSFVMGASLGSQEAQTAPWFESAPAQVSNADRLIHAKEVLGRKYKKLVRVTEKTEQLHLFIYENVLKRLPAAFKKQAREVTDTIVSESNKHGFDPLFVTAMIQHESRFKPTAMGGHGEIGLLQMRPETADWFAPKVGLEFTRKEQLNSPVYNIKISLAYLSYLRGRLLKNSLFYISAYNMGISNVKKLVRKAQKPRVYKEKVLAVYHGLYMELTRAIASAEKTVTTLNPAKLDVATASITSEKSKEGKTN